MWSSKFADDTRGTGSVEYAVLLVAVLLVAAGAVKKLGRSVVMDASVTTRILNGENITLRGPSTAPPGGDAVASMGGSFSSSTASERSNAAAATNSGASRAILANGAAFGGGVVLGASGAPPLLGGSSTEALSPGASSGASSTQMAAATAPATAPHFTAALFENRSLPSSAKSVAKAASKVGASVAVKSKPGTLAGASKATVATTTAASNGSYSISSSGKSQMAALLNEAKSSADGKPPLGRCYASVAADIDAVGYGKMGKAPGSSLPSVPDAYGTYAHQFADYMNTKDANGETNASRLGLQKLPITNPYDAPPGSIVVVRAGTPGTANPIAGDIVVVGKNGQFYNDGNMGYRGAQNFPKGNTYVLGVYAPK